MNDKWVRALLVILVAGGLWAPNAAAQVKADPAGGIAYSGFLEKDGTPVHGTVSLKFRLFDADSDGNQIGDDLTASDVEVHAGRFSVILAPFPRAAFSNGPVYLEITVVEDSEEITLVGRQQILAAPYALGTTNGNDFSIMGALGIGGGIPDAASAAVVVGTGADHPDADPVGVLVPESTIDIPIGDEAAGGLLLRDAQNPADQAQVDYDTAEGTQLRLLNKGKGVRIDSGGNVKVDGTVRWKCPAGMTRLGIWCIDDEERTSANFRDATKVCHDHFAMICPLSVYLTCDIADQWAEPPDTGCIASTDDNGTTLWTSGSAYETYTDSVFTELAGYNGGDNSIDRLNEDNSYPYYCCIPGYFFD
jgi:hypothetical protein